MANKEVFQSTNKKDTRNDGAVDKGLTAWKGVNNVQRVIGAGALGVGVVIGAPVLVALGAGEVVVDTAQNYLIDNVREKRRKKAGTQVVMKQGHEYKLSNN